MPFVVVRDLRVEFPGVTAVDGVSFELAPGECLALVGESGSGKTMTALALLGLLPDAARASAAELTVAGVTAADVVGNGRARRWAGIRGRLAGLVSQDALVSLDPLRRIGREVAEAFEVQQPSASRERVRERVLASLEAAAVPDARERARQYPHQLSGGLRQRSLIASAISAQPLLLIADEPTTALDSRAQARVLSLLDDLRRDGLALLLISHDLGMVARVADRIAVMQAGRIVEEADAATLLSAPQHPYTRALLDAAPSPRGHAASGGDVVLEARGLVRRYSVRGGSRLAVGGVSFALREGTTLGVVGESGSGKSTLARLLLALERADEGEVRLEGNAWSTLSERERRRRRDRIQLIDQDPFGTLNPRWNVQRVLAEAVALAGDTDVPSRIRELLALVALDATVLSRRARELSGGQRQRVAIARALARRPAVLVCDEPVSALEVSVQAQVLDTLEDVRRRLGLSLVFISHDLDVFAHVSDEILVMKDGLVIERGSVSDVLNAPRHAFTRELVAAAFPAQD